MTHTLGPWTPAIGIDTWKVFQANNANHEICTSGIGPEYKNGANARLIAAAPKLFEALKQQVAFHEELAAIGHECDPACQLDQAQATIAKAEGS